MKKKKLFSKKYICNIPKIEMRLTKNQRSFLQLVYAMIPRLLLLLLLLVPWPGLARQECCPHLEVSSRGEAARRQPQRLGVFTRTDQGWADRPIYKHQDRSEYLFYLHTKSKGLWMVGPKVSAGLN